MNEQEGVHPLLSPKGTSCGAYISPRTQGHHWVRVNSK